jgi:hypothetical protein
MFTCLFAISHRQSLLGGRDRGACVARCKVYEIQGPDPRKTDGAVRCHRDAHGETTVDGTGYPICRHHSHKRWQLFTKNRWLYAIDLNAEAPKRPKPKKR